MSKTPLVGDIYEELPKRFVYCELLLKKAGAIDRSHPSDAIFLLRDKNAFCCSPRPIFGCQAAVIALEGYILGASCVVSLELKGSARKTENEGVKAPPPRARKAGSTEFVPGEAAFLVQVRVRLASCRVGLPLPPQCNG